MVKTESPLGRGVLMVAHCAGMIDLVTLPVWVGTLISQYHFDPQKAGALATLFLAGAVTASLFFAPRFQRIMGRVAAPAGYGAAAMAFALMSVMQDFGAMALLHALAGFSAGCGLSFTHGTMGRSANPHRLFAMAGLALGVFAILMLGSLPGLIASAGGPALFQVFAAAMAVTAVVAAIAFPQPQAMEAGPMAHAGRLPSTVWRAMAGVSCMALVQAMLFSFVERIAAERFGMPAVATLLIAMGFVTLLPAPLAAWLEKRVAPRLVVLLGPPAQVAVAFGITQSQVFEPYAAAAILLPCVMIFTHTFAFGLIARLDPTGRAVAATPAMTMIGAAVGPLLGGTLVRTGGYGGLATAACVVAAVAVICFATLRRPAASIAAAA
jgi:predicted MFS family arabinose efflux permease